LKELLEDIVLRARSIRQSDRGTQSRNYSSHFYIAHEFDDLLSSLELEFFITKYFEQSDRSGARVSVYALNYGLCIKYQINFGRPMEKREDRLYFVERVFDYNAILRAYMAANQEIVCNGCEKRFEISSLPHFKTFRMRCPSCPTGSCEVVNLSKKYGDMLEAIRPELLLPKIELGILQTLHHENRQMVASEIASELDCSGQLVGRRAKNLSERTLVKRVQGNVYRYEITEKANAAYFDDSSAAELQLNESLPCQPQDA
jgi:DNA-binding MarR family transcriptional regulator